MDYQKTGPADTEYVMMLPKELAVRFKTDGMEPAGVCICDKHGFGVMILIDRDCATRPHPVDEVIWCLEHAMHAFLSTVVADAKPLGTDFTDADPESH